MEQLNANEIARNITITMSVSKAARQLEWRLRIAQLLFKMGTWFIGCKFKTEDLDE